MDGVAISLREAKVHPGLRTCCVQLCRTFCPALTDLVVASALLLFLDVTTRHISGCQAQRPKLRGLNRMLTGYMPLSREQGRGALYRLHDKDIRTARSRQPTSRELLALPILGCTHGDSVARASVIYDPRPDHPRPHMEI